MVTAAEIRDEDSLETWLRTRPRADAVAVAHRAALRMLPLWGAVMDAGWAGKRAVTALPLLRCDLISAVAALVPTADIEDAAYDAARLANATDIPRAVRSTGFDADVIATVATRVANATGLDADAIATAARAADATGVDADTIATEAITYAARAAARAAADVARVAVHTATAATATRAAADVARVAAATMWQEIRTDAQRLEEGTLPLRARLWSSEEPPKVQSAEAAMLLIWQSDPPSRWDFWHRWWEGAKSGNPLDPDLQLAIVRGIHDDTWQDPDATAARIREIEAAFYDNSQDFDATLRAMPKAETSRAEHTKIAIERHRTELPPTFDAILGYIALEIERLRARNFRTQEEAEEAERQTLILAIIAKAVEGLLALVPATDTMPKADAEQAERLGRLYLRKYAEWARSSADEIVDSSARFGLAGASTLALTWLGLPAAMVMPCSLAVFASKDMIDKAKTAKDLLPSKSGDKDA